jgi:hypothetical protein
MHEQKPNVYGSLLCINEWGVLCCYNSDLRAVQGLSERPRQNSAGEWTCYLYSGIFLIPNQSSPPF